MHSRPEAPIPRPCKPPPKRQPPPVPALAHPTSLDYAGTRAEPIPIDVSDHELLLDKPWRCITSFEGYGPIGRHPGYGVPDPRPYYLIVHRSSGCQHRDHETIETAKELSAHLGRARFDQLWTELLCHDLYQQELPAHLQHEENHHGLQLGYCKRKDRDLEDPTPCGCFLQG